MDNTRMDRKIKTHPMIKENILPDGIYRASSPPLSPRQRPPSGASHGDELQTRLSNIGLNDADYECIINTKDPPGARPKVITLKTICNTLLGKLGPTTSTHLKTPQVRARLNHLIGLCTAIERDGLDPNKKDYFMCGLERTAETPTHFPITSTSPFVSDIMELLDSVDELKPASLAAWGAMWESVSHPNRLDAALGKDPKEVFDALWNGMGGMSDQEKKAILELAIQKNVIKPTDNLLTDYINLKTSREQGSIQNLTGDLEHHLVRHGLILPNSTPRQFKEAKATAWCKKNEGAKESLGILAVMLNDKKTGPVNTNNIDKLLRIRGAPGGVRNSEALATLSNNPNAGDVTIMQHSKKIEEFLNKETPPQYQRPPLLSDRSIDTIINELKSHANAWEVFAAIDPMAWQHMSDSEVTTGPLHGRPDTPINVAGPYPARKKRKRSNDNEITQNFEALTAAIQKDIDKPISNIPPLDALIKKTSEKETELQGAIQVLEDKQQALETRIKEINDENSKIDRYRNDKKGDDDLGFLPDNLRKMIKARQSMGNAGLNTAPINGIINGALGTIQSNNRSALERYQTQFDSINSLKNNHDNQIGKLRRVVEEFKKTHNQEEAKLKAQQEEIERDRGVLEVVHNGHHKPSEAGELREYIKRNEERLEAYKKQRTTFEAHIRDLLNQIDAEKTKIEQIDASETTFPIADRPLNNPDLDAFKEGLKTALYEKNPLQPEKILNALLHGLNEGTGEGLNHDQLTTLVKEVWEKLPWTEIFTGAVQSSSWNKVLQSIQAQEFEQHNIASLQTAVNTQLNQNQQTNPTIAKLIGDFELDNLQPPLTGKNLQTLGKKAKQFSTFKAAEKEADERVTAENIRHQKNNQDHAKLLQDINDQIAAIACPKRQHILLHVL